MAVEAKRIKGRLRVLFPKANLSKKRLDEIAARLAKKPDDDAEDSVIDEIINNANELLPFEEIAKEDDRVRALEAKFLKKKESEEESDEGPDNDGGGKTTQKKDDDDTPAWAKSTLEKMEALQKELSDLKKGRIADSKKEQARKLFEQNDTFKSLKETNKEFFFKQIDVDSETPIDEQIENLEAQYNDLVQQKADSREYSSTPPTGTGNNGEPTKDELEAVARDL